MENSIEIMTLEDFLNYFGLGVDATGDSITVMEEDGSDGGSYACSTAGIMQIINDYEGLIYPVFGEAAAIIDFEDYEEGDQLQQEEIFNISIEALDENTLDEYNEEHLNELLQVMNSVLNPESIEFE